MKHTALLLAALALPLPAAVSTTGERNVEEIVFAPSAGSKVTKTFENVMDFVLEDMSVLMNGEEAPFMGDMEMDMTSTTVVAVTDEYARMGEGRPEVLRRTFDDIGMEMDMEMSMEVMGQVQDQAPTGSGSSPLEGKTVVFTDNEGAYEVAWAEGEEDDPELIDGLVEDMDLRALLPPGSVAVGESWEIELMGLVDLYAPGGDLKMDVEMDMGGADMMGGGGMDPAHMREYFGELMEGDARATLASVRDDGGQRIAVIDLAIEIDTSADVSELMNEQMEGMPQGMEVSLDRADVELSIQSTGQLLWNLSAGHVQGLTLEGDTEFAMDIEMSMDMAGQAMDMEMSMEMSGTSETNLSVE